MTPVSELFYFFYFYMRDPPSETIMIAIIIPGRAPNLH